MNGFYLSYPETRRNDFGLDALFCDVVIEFFFDCIIDILMCLFDVL